MDLYSLLREKKKTILNNWLDDLLSSYPPESAQFFKSNPNQFSNPVGNTFRLNLEKIYDELLQDKCSEKLPEWLDGIIRIRSLQELHPSLSLNFAFSLKKIVWNSLKKEIKKHNLYEDYYKFSQRIDELLGLAFDIYMQCREKIWSQKANYINSRVHKLLERAGYIKEVEAF
ncbi:MAG: RsbRD N-terminal domain-containing protein [Desulfonauticus sp.]|nr:RsbRD N-terminal domain-containing protein [Desulfonauticus sp.]